MNEQKEEENLLSEINDIQQQIEAFRLYEYKKIQQQQQQVQQKQQVQQQQVQRRKEDSYIQSYDKELKVQQLPKNYIIYLKETGSGGDCLFSSLAYSLNNLLTTQQSTFQNKDFQRLAKGFKEKFTSKEDRIELLRNITSTFINVNNVKECIQKMMSEKNNLSDSTLLYEISQLKSPEIQLEEIDTFITTMGTTYQGDLVTLEFLANSRAFTNADIGIIALFTTKVKGENVSGVTCETFPPLINYVDVSYKPRRFYLLVCNIDLIHWQAAYWVTTNKLEEPHYYVDILEKKNDPIFQFHEIMCGRN